MIFVSTYLECKEFCWLILNEQISKKKCRSRKKVLINLYSLTIQALVRFSCKYSLLNIIL